MTLLFRKNETEVDYYGVMALTFSYIMNLHTNFPSHLLALLTLFPHSNKKSLNANQKEKALSAVVTILIHGTRGRLATLKYRYPKRIRLPHIW